MDYTTTTFSNRMYDLNNDYKEAINDTMVAFCRGVYSSYNKHFLKEYNKNAFKEQYGDTSLHMIIKKQLGCNDYYANSITQLAKGKLESQKELLKIYKKDKEEQLKSIDKKLKEETDKLAAYEKILKNLYEYRENLKSNPKAKLKVSRFKNISSNGYIITVRTPLKNRFKSTEYGLYAFEYNYLNPQIAFTKNKISKLKYRRNNVNTKLENLEKPKHIVFGGKRNLKNLTHNELMLKKYNEFTISGRKDGKYGNFVFKATPIKDDIFDIDTTLIDGKKLTFKNIQFPYHGKELAQVLKKDVPNKEMTAICFGIVRRVDALGREYYQFKVSFNIGSTKRYNDSLIDGCVGMDFNFGHIDATEIDSKGNMVDKISIPYRTDGNTYENEISLREALNKVGVWTQSKHKTLVVEKLDTSNSKRKSTYRDPKTNKIFHMLPYSRYLEAVQYIGFKYGFEITKVAPSYTSVIGSIKYAKKMKLNNHIAASFVIARRGMSFSHNEKIPKEYKHLINKEMKTKHYWSKFNHINQALKKAEKISANK